MSEIICIFTYNLKPFIMWTLKCNYYRKEFATLDLLLEDIIQSGMDPNYEICLNGRPTGDVAIDLIQF